MTDLGISNSTNITMDVINGLINKTDYSEMMVAVNNDIFMGWLYFILLCVLAFVVWTGLNNVTQEPLPNALAITFICSILGFYMRALQLMTDRIVWFFPALTLLIVAIMYASKQSG
jgi:CBS domain containing-hemolysin-like protein